MVLCLGRGRGRRFLVFCDVFGANVVRGASVLRVTGSMSVAGTMLVSVASVSDVTGSKTDVGGGVSGFAVGLESKCFAGFESIVGTRGSGGTTAGSRAGLDLGTCGLGVVLGRRRRPGRLVFGGANVVVEDLVSSVPGSKTGLLSVTSGLRGILGFKEINCVLLGAIVVRLGSGLLEILGVIVPGLVVLSGLVLGVLGLRRLLGVEGTDVVCRGADVVDCISGLVKISSF